MAIQIKVIDTTLNEHIFMVNGYSDILISESNDWRFKVSFAELLEEAEYDLERKAT